jgi:hypothetical protein
VSKKYPEGSIAEGYIVGEFLTYCSRYFSADMETRFNKDERNQDNKRTVGTRMKGIRWNKRVGEIIVEMF